MKRAFSHILFVSLLALCGCTLSAGPKEPQWVRTPSAVADEGRFVHAAGAAQARPGAEPSERRAEYQARAQLAITVQSYVQDILGRFLQSHRNLADPASHMWGQFVSSLSMQVSSTVLRRSSKYDSWTNPKDRTAYVLYRMPVSVIHDRINEEIRVSVRDMNPFAGMQEEALAQLRAFMDESLKKRIRKAAFAEKPRREKATGADDGEPPAWLTGTGQTLFPSEKFVTAVGLADGREEAAKAARAELLKQIEVGLINQFLKTVGSKGTGKSAGNLRYVRQETLAFTESDRVSSMIDRTWYDPVTHTHYALAVLKRITAASVYRKGIASAVKRADSLLKSARNHHKADNYGIALLEYIEALARAQEAVKTQLTAMVVMPTQGEEFAGTVPEGLLVRATEGARELLGEMAFEKRGGDNQWTPPGMALTKPLSVKLLTCEGRKPVAKVPVRFSFVEGEGSLKEAGATGEDGVVSCRVERVAQKAVAINVIRAEVDVKRLAPKADLSWINAPAVEFRCVTRSRSNTFFAVYVDERTLGGAAAATSVAWETVVSEMTGHKLNLIDRSEVRKLAAGISGQAGEEELLRAFASLREGLPGKGFVLLVVGRVDVRPLETVETGGGKLCIVEALMRLRVIDEALRHDAKRTVLVVSKTGRGAFVDNEQEAARRARLAAAKVCSEDLVHKLKERFGLR